MRKLIIFGILLIILSSNSVLGYGLISTLSFEGSAELDTEEELEYGLLSTLSFGGSVEILENSCPESSNYSIENTTTNVIIIKHS